MDYKKISLFVAESVEDLIYLSDLETYQLYYINKNTIDEFSKHDKNFTWEGRKCYEVLQGKNSPCEFCTNKLLSKDEFYIWEYLNPITGKHYLLKDKLVEIDGKTLRVEIATDTTTHFLLNQDLSQKLTEQELLTSCVQTLHTSDDTEVSILKILKSIGEYYSADRCYIFTVSKEGHTISNEYEWTHHTAIPSKDDLTNVSSAPFQRWIDTFKNHNELTYFEENNEELPILEAELLKKYGVTNFLAVPLKDVNGTLEGFIGVDNPKLFATNTKIFRDLSLFISNFFDKNILLTNLHTLSFYDKGSGLKNRNSYNEYLQTFDKNPPKTLGVIVLDIKSLKLINDLHGYSYGDTVILKLASLLKNYFGNDVYRLGGDDFVVLSRDLTEEDFENSVYNFQNSLKSEDFEINLGYAFNKSYENVPLNEANLRNINNAKYSELLLKNLEEELKNDKFVVYLQPQFNLKTNKISGAEALIRKYDSKGNIKPPISFLPFYEKESMISYIDFFVFESICKFLSEIKTEGFLNDLQMSVNFSRNSLSQNNIVEKLLNICSSYNISPSSFVIEVTETVDGIDDGYLIELIEDFNNAGFFVSLDDFGAGYSNLAILTKANFHEIKIDKTIIDSFETNPKSKLITKWAIDLCNTFNNIKSVAEGIETQQQYESLKEFGCTIGQGYYFAKPMPLNEFWKNYIK